MCDIFWTHAVVNELKCPLWTMLSLLNYENKKNLSITFSYYWLLSAKAWKFCRNNCKFLSGLNDWVMVAQHKFILQLDLIGSSYFSFTSGFLQRRRLKSMFFSSLKSTWQQMCNLCSLCSPLKHAFQTLFLLLLTGCLLNAFSSFNKTVL